MQSSCARIKACCVPYFQRIRKLLIYLDKYELSFIFLSDVSFPCKKCRQFFGEAAIKQPANNSGQTMASV